MTPEDFDALFDEFRHTAYRLETRPSYDVGDIGDEADRIRAIRDGRPVPERSVRTDPWMARIARSTIVDGKRWQRIRVMDDPLTEYQRIELVALVEAQAVGDENFIVPRAVIGNQLPEAWLFDAGTKHAQAVLMNYDADGQWLGFAVASDDLCCDIELTWEQAMEFAVPLNEFLARGGYEAARLARA